MKRIVRKRKRTRGFTFSLGMEASMPPIVNGSPFLFALGCVKDQQRRDGPDDRQHCCGSGTIEA